MSVFLSPEAEEQLGTLLDYLDTSWSTKVCDNFIEKFEHALHTISWSPLAYPLSDKLPGVHKCVVTRQTSIYYRITGNTIEIVSISDNRQNL